MRRTFVSLLLTTVMICTMVVGCGEKKQSGVKQGGNDAPVVNDDASKEKKVLTMLTPVDPSTGDVGAEAQCEIFQKFTEDTGIEIEYTIAPWDQVESKLVITNEAGSPCDLGMISSQKIASLVNSGAVMPLDDMIDRDMKRNELSDAVWNAGTYAGDGHVYCILMTVHTRGLWYNTEYVKEPPKTWDEVIKISQQVMKDNEGVYGFGFWGGNHYGSAECAIAPFTWAGGSALCDNDGKAAWANEGTADAIRFMSDCVNKYKISPESCLNITDFATEVEEIFKSGNLAMVLDGSYARALYADSEYVDKFKFVPFPAKEEGGPSPHFSNGWAWAIPKNASNPDLAWKFINWFSQQDIQKEFSQVEGGLPISIAAQSDPVFGDELTQSFLKNVNDNGRSMDPLVYYQEALSELAIASATYGLKPEETDLEAILKESQDEFNKKYYNDK